MYTIYTHNDTSCSVMGDIVLYLLLHCAVILQYWNMGVLPPQCQVTKTTSEVTKRTKSTTTPSTRCNASQEVSVVCCILCSCFILFCRRALFYSDIAQRWCFPFPGPDKAVVRINDQCYYCCVGPALNNS